MSKNVIEVKNLETLYRDTVKQESFDFKMREHYKNPDVNPGYSAKSDQPRAKVPIKSLFVTGLLTTAASFAHRDGGITDSGLLLSETRSTDALLVFTKLEKRLRKLHNCTGT